MSSAMPKKFQEIVLQTIYEEILCSGFPQKMQTVDSVSFLACYHQAYIAAEFLW